MTRVLMSADAVGGVWTYALELADALARLGVEVHLAVLGTEPGVEQRRELRASALASYAFAPLALEWMPDPWAEVDASGRWLLDQVERVQPDVVHLNSYALADLDWPAPVVVVAHSDVLSWWRAVHGVPAPPDWDRYRARVAAGLAAADAVVAPTAAVLNDLAREFTAAPDGLVVPNCRRRDWVVRTPKQPLVLAAGRAWDEAKGLAALDRIAPELSWPVLIAGAGGGPSARFLGSLSFAEFRPWLLRAAVFAAPAHYEPFGLAILEAACAGCALVLSDLPSLREVWGDAALYMPPGDDDALAAALQRIIADPRRTTELGGRARLRSERYLPQRTAAGYLALYQRLLTAVRT
jgi:glycosyltransferase involved in cell wall biosynthesis